jgi:hypothetical protein
VGITQGFDGRKIAAHADANVPGEFRNQGPKTLVPARRNEVSKLARLAPVPVIRVAQRAASDRRLLRND